ncbi:N-formylglutamate amidohydrolase [Dongia rigui]|uniref:N-formylglutamate amidohydrolase n=1 Tax=Dongia rigui TaxID=940149 RepID=A0ABU5DUS9_9PROT|nr:N-formylglutamate amidohydrolase [Dongia rigui]MDY0871047.1 N-formylglutamate amidohydrolase [Dongia rigui]
MTDTSASSMLEPNDGQLHETHGETTSLNRDSEPLLGRGDPPPFTLLNENGQAPLVIFCDHAGRAIPRKLGNLGLTPGELAQHIAWDIGIANVAAILARNLDAPCVLSNYSRLVIDCNRRLDDPTSIAQESDRIVVPGNRGLDGLARAHRAEEIFKPYHFAVADLIKKKREAGPVTAILSLHSFTPVMNGFKRPWHFGVLWNRDARLPIPLMQRLAQLPHVVVGDNEPYSGRDEHGFSIIYHAEAQGLPHALIEIRQDLISDEAGVNRWTAKLETAVKGLLIDPTIFPQRK